MAGNIYNNQSVVGAAGSMNYAINPYAMALGIDQLRDNLVVTALVSNYSQVARNQGTRFSNAVRIPKYGSLSAETKTPGLAAKYQQPTMDKVDITIDTHKTVDFLIEDFGGLFDPATKEAYSREAGAVLADAVEADVIALYASAGSTLGSVAQKADASFVAFIAKAARSGKWRANAEKFIVWGPEAEYDLVTSTVFQSSLVQGGDQSALRTSEIGTLHGFRNFVSSAMPAVAGSPNAEHGIAFQREAMGIVFMDMALGDATPGVEVTPMNASDDNGNLVYSMRSLVGYNQEHRGIAVSFDTIYGVGVVNDDLLIDLTIGNY